MAIKGRLEEIERQLGRQRSRNRWLLIVIILMVGGLVFPILIDTMAFRVGAQGKKEIVQESLPYLSEKVRSLDQDIYPAFLEYAGRVLKSDWIKTDDDLSLLLEKRTSLLEQINESEPLCDFLYNEAEKRHINNNSGDWKKYDRELGLIGIRSVFAESMLTGFVEGPVLEDVINRVASEPYRLFIRMTEAYAGSYGSEYTYLDLKPEMETIAIGERLLASFPESKHVEPAKLLLRKALFPLTDWHVMLPYDPTSTDESDDHPFCIVGGLNASTFPFWTDIGEPREFLKEYPDSRFHDVIAKIVEEPSEIKWKYRVHVVVVDDFRDEESARKAIFSYLLNGIDIPHLIIFSETSYVVSYRFFADPEKAKRALERIIKIKPAATIREVYPTGDNSVVRTAHLLHIHQTMDWASI